MAIKRSTCMSHLDWGTMSIKPSANMAQLTLWQDPFTCWQLLAWSNIQKSNFQSAIEHVHVDLEALTKRYLWQFTWVAQRRFSKYRYKTIQGKHINKEISWTLVLSGLFVFLSFIQTWISPASIKHFRKVYSFPPPLIVGF